MFPVVTLQRTYGECVYEKTIQVAIVGDTFRGGKALIPSGKKSFFVTHHQKNNTCTNTRFLIPRKRHSLIIIQAFAVNAVGIQ